MKHTKTTIPTGFKIVNGERIPLSEEEQKRDEIYSNDIISMFTPKISVRYI